MLSLVAKSLRGVEGILYFQRVCTTRQFNLFLLLRTETILDQVSVTDCLAT